VDDFIELYGRRDAGKILPLEMETNAGAVAERTIAWIAAAPRPFFLLVLTVDPHGPYQPPDAFDRYGGAYDGPVNGDREWLMQPLDRAGRDRIRALYLGEVAYNDFAFAQVLDALDASDLARDTITVFTSDHGEEFWEHDRRGHGLSLYEHAIRVPLIIRYPREIQSGVRERPASLVDLTPTLVALAGLPAEAMPPFDGRDLLAAPTGVVDAGPGIWASLHFEHKPQEGAQISRYKSLIDWPWKLIHNEGSGAYELLHLEDDPYETRNRASDEPARLAAMRQRLQKWARTHRSMRGEFATPAPLPDDARRALEVLGYLEEDSEPAP
jgi:choline-sulfatase